MITAFMCFIQDEILIAPKLNDNIYLIANTQQSEEKLTCIKYQTDIAVTAVNMDATNNDITPITGLDLTTAKPVIHPLENRIIGKQRNRASYLL